MNLETRSICLNHPRLSDPMECQANQALMSDQTPVSPGKTKQSSLPQRQLAWQVAPNLLTSFRYAWAGLKYAFGTQRNFRIHALIGVLAISLGIFLGITSTEMALIGLTVALVLVLELINTALESVVDLTVKQTYHELAKIAKDCAAGAVLVGAIAAVFVAALILLPPLVKLIY